MLWLRLNGAKCLLWLMLALPVGAEASEGLLGARFSPVAGNPDALDFALEDRFGEVRRLSQHRGQVVVVTGSGPNIHEGVTTLVAELMRVGIVDGEPLLDLDYPEDSTAQVDMNVVATEAGHFIEVQGTAEGHPFRREELDELLELAIEGILTLVRAQKAALGIG